MAKPSEGGQRLLAGLSVRQPWAWAISDLDKRAENRSWIPHHVLGIPLRYSWIQIAGCSRRPVYGVLEAEVWLAIHAPQRVERDSLDDIREMARASLGIRMPTRLPTSAVVAVTRLESVVDLRLGTPRYADAPWAFGPWVWELGDVIRLGTPVPVAKGALGLWRLPPDAQEALAVEVERYSQSKKADRAQPSTPQMR